MRTRVPSRPLMLLVLSASAGALRCAPRVSGVRMGLVEGAPRIIISPSHTRRRACAWQ